MTSASKTYSVRAATIADLPSIVGIYNWAINQTFATIDAEPLSEDEAATWWQSHASNNVVLVAEEDGDVIGWARLLPWKQRGYDIVEDLVYVDPVHHGRGVGHELLAGAIDAARGKQCRTIVASVASENRAGLQLHQSLGFEVVGTLKDAAYKFNRWMDVTLVQRSLEG